MSCGRWSHSANPAPLWASWYRIRLLNIRHVLVRQCGDARQRIAERCFDPCNRTAGWTGVDAPPPVKRERCSAAYQWAGKALYGPWNRRKTQRCNASLRRAYSASGASGGGLRSLRYAAHWNHTSGRLAASLFHHWESVRIADALGFSRSPLKKPGATGQPRQPLPGGGKSGGTSLLVKLVYRSANIPANTGFECIC